MSNSALSDRSNPIKTTASEQFEFFQALRQSQVRAGMVKNSFYVFEEKPENYRSWQATFQAGIKEYGSDAREELDYLIKYCGRSYAPHLQRIRNAHLHDQEGGLREAWARLNKRFGDPYLMASSLLKEIEAFPEIGTYQYEKLQEFSDNLETINSAKKGGELPDLYFLDTTQGMNNVIKKLPFYMRSKWQNIAYDFSEANSGNLPPFNDLCKFVKRFSDQKNDRRFDFGTTTSDTRKAQGSVKSFNGRDPPASKPRIIKPILVQKTEVTQPPQTKSKKKE